MLYTAVWQRQVLRDVHSLLCPAGFKPEFRFSGNERSLMKKRELFSFLAAGVMALSMLGGSVYAEDAAADSTAAGDNAAAADSSSSGMVQSYLTGKQVPASYGRKRPLAIMIENTPDALPQFGIENADVVYEAMVEGSITRLMGIFENY